MKLKNFSKRTLFLVILAGVAFLGIIFFYFIKQGFNFPIATETTITDEEEKVKFSADQVSFGLPVRLKIPEINVDAGIERVGITTNGEVDVPKNATDVGWFELGKRPGENGSAVIVGHYGTWKNGQGSVFDDLNKLKEGDAIYIEDENGTTNTFVVREFRIYEPDADTSTVFVSNDEKAHLNLITCEGIWNKNSKSYSRRLVVFADKKDE